MPTYDIATRAHALALRNKGCSYADVTAETGMQTRQIQHVAAEAKKRGWVPGQPIRDVHVKDKPRSGRPPKLTPEQVEQLVEAHAVNAEMPAVAFGKDFGVSQSTVLRLRKARKIKKPKTA